MIADPWKGVLSRKKNLDAREFAAHNAHPEFDHRTRMRLEGERGARGLAIRDACLLPSATEFQFFILVSSVHTENVWCSNYRIHNASLRCEKPRCKV